MSVLDIRQLVLDIPGRHDRQPMDLMVEPGQMWGILGPNGAGKTTLLHTLAGLRAARSGQIVLDGRPLNRIARRALAQKMGVVFQEHHPGLPITVREFVLAGRHPNLSAWSAMRPDDRDKAEAALTRMDLAALQHQPMSTLSGGEQQRAAIATTLTQSPAIWLVDEPTNHLDLRHQISVMEMLAEQADAGCAIVMCLHDINLAARWCDRLLLLYPDGEVGTGLKNDLLTPAELQRLYGQPLIEVAADGERFFLARDRRRL